MEEIYEKMVNEAMAAQRADVDTISKNRGKKFKLSDGKAYVDAVKDMTVVDGQSEAVINLHKNSVINHYKTLEGLETNFKVEDDPFIEHFQTPPILETLYEEDEAFKESSDKFIEKIADCADIIGKEVVRRYGGFYGPTCVVDFALIPGSSSNIVNQILTKTDIPKDHKEAILASKSWGMNTSYGFGEKFALGLEAGLTVSEALEEEIATIQQIYASPIDAQAEIMKGAGHTSFDVKKYMKNYQAAMKSTVEEAIADGVHYANIVTVPAYCVGDISHHIAQSTYNMCKDDMIMAIIEAVTDVMDSTLNKALPSFENPNQVVSLATGAAASAAEYILELDGLNAHMVVDLLTKRFHNYVQLFPERSAAAELHNSDFMDTLYRGWGYLDSARKANSSSGTKIVPIVNGFPVDLEPINNNDVIMNPQRYTYPVCAITVRFSSLMRLSDYPCLITSEPVTATMMTNIIALNKENPGAPVRGCKNCATASLIDFRHQYCQWKEGV